MGDSSLNLSSGVAGSPGPAGGHDGGGGGGPGVPEPQLRHPRHRWGGPGSRSVRTSHFSVINIKLQVVSAEISKADFNWAAAALPPAHQSCLQANEVKNYWLDFLMTEIVTGFSWKWTLFLPELDALGDELLLDDDSSYLDEASAAPSIPEGIPSDSKTNKVTRGVTRLQI